VIRRDLLEVEDFLLGGTEDSPVETGVSPGEMEDSPQAVTGVVEKVRGGAEEQEMLENQSRPRPPLAIGKHISLELYLLIVDKSFSLGRAGAAAPADGGEKKQAQPAAVAERPIPEPAPVPASNQWAKGKPKIENPQEKIIPPPVISVPQQPAPPPIPAPQSVSASPQQLPQQSQPIQQLPTALPPAQQAPSAAVSNEIPSAINDQGSVGSGSWGSSQPEAATASNIKVPIHSANGAAAALPSHAPAHTAPVVGSTGAARAESIDKSQDARYRERSSVPTATETDTLRNNFASLNVGQQTKIEGQVPAQQSSTAATMQSNAFSSAPSDNQQMPYGMPGQTGTNTYGQPYPQYAPQYNQQFTQMQTSYPQTQDGEEFNPSRMGMTESGYGISGADSGQVAQRGNAGNYGGGKGGHGKQVQQPPQQPALGMQQWQQSPLAYNGMAAMYGQYMAGMSGIPAMSAMSGMSGMPAAQQVSCNWMVWVDFFVSNCHVLRSAYVHAIIHALHCRRNARTDVQQCNRICRAAERSNDVKAAVQYAKSEQGRSLYCFCCSNFI
jgi:hypothetical protein